MQGGEDGRIQNSGGFCSVVEKAVKWGGGEMKNYELRWGKTPPRSKVLAQSTAVFSATPSAELKLVV